MNWTGGRLQRHSGKSARGGGGGALTKRQKEHFAKVNANLRTGRQKNVTTEWTIFDNIIVEQSHRQSFGNNVDSVKNSECSLRQGRGRNEVERKHFTDLYKHNDLTSTPLCRDLQYEQKNNRSSPFEIVQRSSIADDDLYNATPPPLKIKREYAASSELRDDLQNYEAQEATEQSMEEIRRNLLKQKDWVGLNIHHLPKLRFNQPRHDEDIGRRRKVKGGHRARYSKLQTRIRSPFAARNTQMREQQEAGYMEGRPPKNDVRISIGGRVVPPGMSSSSRPTKVIRQSTPRTKHRMLSSDDMLLDDECIVEDQEDLNSDRFLSIFEATIHGNGEDDTSTRIIPSSRGPENHGTHGNQGKGANTRREPLLNITNGNGASNKFGGKESPFSRTAVRSICDTRMKQPMPIRPAHHPVLRLSSPKCNSSVLGQIGGLRSVVSEDQLMNNEMWKAWIPPPTEGTEHKNYDEAGEDEEYLKDRSVSISPGISAIPALREKIFSSSGSNDKDSAGQYEHTESWRGCESSIIQEQSTAVYKTDLFPSDDVKNISYNGMPHSSDVYDHPFSSDKCELGNERKTSLASIQYTNEDGITIEPQDSRSSQRTSSSIPWDPPRSSSPCITSRSHSKFLSNPWSEALPVQQTPIDSRQITELKEAAPQHDQIIMRDQTFGKVKDCPTQGVQKKTDPNELWMKFVFDDISEEEDMVLEKTTPAGFELEEKEPSPSFSTFVHNSVDSESPLQPRYVAQASNRNTWQDTLQRNSSARGDEFGPSPLYSTFACHSIINRDPVGAAVRNKSTPYPHETKHHQTNRNLSSNNCASESAVDSTNSRIPTDSTSSSPKTDSLSMMAVSGSQINTSTTTTQRRFFLEPHRKILFTKPQPFIGSKSDINFSSPDRIVRIGGRDVKTQMSSGNGMIFPEEIEDD
ncbi:uncharacterized protein Bfra_003602 [Botrytis fragariae]|uniref:Uncharacterized protein n=1 Tax=Botrytis fragariae TaxID=1964551 RepID=A0A8H6AX68_9HELO|nr:uncharacterized protein Bfra_003602 [Botrytis fragariae]KAF5875149.1 hypothetical protein Bfra_003602 [Botrytis fragariae]